jgi:hypothetical protein
LEELNEKTAKIEDLPALFVFIVEMVAFPRGISWVSAATGVVSGLMLGRKFSGGAKKAELVAKKRELEEEMEKLGGGGLSLGGTLRGVEAVFGAAAARGMEAEIEEELGERGDVEMAGLETRQAELPGSLGGGEEEEEEGGSLRAQLEQALREKEALRAKADAEAHTMQREAEGLRQRNVRLVEEGEKLQAALEASEVDKRRLLKQREEE